MLFAQKNEKPGKI